MSDIQGVSQSSSTAGSQPAGEDQKSKPEVTAASVIPGGSLDKLQEMSPEVYGEMQKSLFDLMQKEEKARQKRIKENIKEMGK